MMSRLEEIINEIENEYAMNLDNTQYTEYTNYTEYGDCVILS